MKSETKIQECSKENIKCDYYRCEKKATYRVTDPFFLWATGVDHCYYCDEHMPRRLLDEHTES